MKNVILTLNEVKRKNLNKINAQILRPDSGECRRLRGLPRHWPGSRMTLFLFNSARIYRILFAPLLLQALLCPAFASSMTHIFLGPRRPLMDMRLARGTLSPAASTVYVTWTTLFRLRHVHGWMSSAKIHGANRPLRMGVGVQPSLSIEGLRTSLPVNRFLDLTLLRMDRDRGDGVPHEEMSLQRPLHGTPSPRERGTIRKRVCNQQFVEVHRQAEKMSITLRLTGTSITTSFVQEQLENTLENLYGTKPGVQPFPGFSLMPYHTLKITVPVSISKANTVPFHVRVSSEKAPPFRDALLLFSNHPETLHENGLLFSAGIIFLRPVRLNYYHQNGSNEPPRAVVIRVDNKNSEPAVIHTLEARSGPSKDEISTGHRASVLFLHRHFENLGRIEVIPPNDYLVLSRQVAKPGELVTGFIEVEELKGHPLQIAVFAEDPKMTQKHGTLLDSRDTHARGAYEMSKLCFNTSYKIGDDPKTIPLGDLPLRNLLPGRPLKGAYGMLWEGDIQLENRTLSPEDVPIYFQPRGGAATATFIVNHVYKEIPLTRSYESPMLLEFLLPPKTRQMIHVLTMPEGGSSYPVHLIIGRMKNP